MSRRFAIFAGGWVLAFAASAMAATANDPRSSEQKAVDAQTAQRFEAAAKFYQEFIQSSVGDPRLPKAQKAMLECVGALAKEWSGEGRESDAARLYLWLAGDPSTSAELREDYTKKAPQLLTNAMTEAKVKRNFARALQLQKDWVALFPSTPSPYKPEDLDVFAFEGVAAACQDKLNLLALPDVLAQFYPSSTAPLEQLTKRNHNEPLQVAYLRVLADLGWSGRVIAENQGIAKESPLRAYPTYMSHLERAVMGRVDAWAAQGNLAATQDAIALAKTMLVSENKLALIKKLESKLAKKVVSDPQELAFTGPVKGKVTWQDSGAGFTTREVVLDDGADISILPGFVLSEGQLELHRGARLHLKGSAGQPVVFRDVSLVLHSGAHFDAENAVFINCTFNRAGEGGGRYATKWQFSNCLLYRSSFEGLGLAGFGLSMSNSAWVESTIPQRIVLSQDVAGTYKDKWNGVENCLFYRCAMEPSSIWMTDQCNFVRCSVGREEPFDSKSPLIVGLYVPEGDPMAMKLRTSTMVSDRGDLRYTFVRRPYEVGVPGAFWALLPIDGYELPKRQAATTTPAATTAPATTTATTKPAPTTAPAK